MAPLPIARPRVGVQHRGHWWGGEGSRVSPCPAADVPNAGQRVLALGAAALRVFPRQSAQGPAGLGLGQLQGPSPRLPRGWPDPGALDTPRDLDTPVPGAGFLAVSDLCRERRATFPGERAGAGSSPSSICPGHPEAPEPPHFSGAPVQDQPRHRVPRPPVCAGLGRLELSVPWEEPARTGESL